MGCKLFPRGIALDNWIFECSELESDVETFVEYIMGVESMLVSEVYNKQTKFLDENKKIRNKDSSSIKK